MPPAHMRIRELESENFALKRENDDLRMQLGRVHGNGISVNNHAYGHGGHGGHGGHSGGHGAHGAHNGHSGHVTPTPAPPSLHSSHSHPPPHHGHQHTGPQCCRHDSNPSPVDGIAMGLNSAILDREKKRRRHSGEVDGVYLVRSNTVTPLFLFPSPLPSQILFFFFFLFDISHLVRLRSFDLQCALLYFSQLSVVVDCSSSRRLEMIVPLVSVGTTCPICTDPTAVLTVPLLRIGVLR